MVQKRSIAAGIVGVVCAIAVLAFMALSQSGATLNSMHAVLVSTRTSNTNNPANYGVNNQTTSNPASLNASRSLGFGPQSPQTIGSPTAMFGVAFLGGISLLVGIGVALFVSRRLG